MEIDLDPNKVCAEMASGFVKDTFKACVAFGSSELEKLSIAFETAFSSYLTRNISRLERIKTVLDPSTPIMLMSIFEPPSFDLEEENLGSSEFLLRIESSKFIAVTGTGGSGKSVFLRYTFLHYAKNYLGRIPIYMELRLVQADESLITAIIRELNIKCDLDVAGLEHALSMGKFLLLFDALDEVEEAQRERVSNEIKELSYRYDKNCIFLSSRPSENFLGWTEFQVARISAFSREQVISLIKKLKYEEGAKDAFLSAVEDKLYSTHRSYLSNPLLCIIMLMTFDQGAGIPAKRHLFFDQAFDVLFYKHDSTKTGYYRRLFQTELDIDKFKNAFGTFSAFSYIGKGSSFMRSEAVDFAKDALEYDQLAKDPDYFVNDLLNRMCLLIAEGSRLSYIHRSFQEFFAAHFIAYRSFDNWEGVVHQVVEEKPNDSVISMLQEMIPARFNEKYLLPRLEVALTKLSSIDRVANPADFAKLFYLGFGVRSDDKTSISYYRFKDRHQSAEFNFLNNIFNSDRFMFGDGDWAQFFEKAPDARETDHGLEYLFDDLAPEIIMICPVYDKIISFVSMITAKRDEIMDNIVRKDRLIFSSIVEKLQKS